MYADAGFKHQASALTQQKQAPSPNHKGGMTQHACCQVSPITTEWVAHNTRTVIADKFPVTAKTCISRQTALAHSNPQQLTLCTLPKEEGGQQSKWMAMVTQESLSLPKPGDKGRASYVNACFHARVTANAVIEDTPVFDYPMTQASFQ